jgi:hypothetical protein
MAPDDNSGARPAAPVVLRIKLRYDDVDAMVQRFASNVGKSGLFLPTKSIQPVGTEVKFELRLANDVPVLVGMGRVKHVKPPDPAHPKAAFGMGIELMRVSREGREVIIRMLERRRALGLPDVAIPVPEDVDTSRRNEIETVPRGETSGVVQEAMAQLASAQVSEPLLAAKPASGPIGVAKQEAGPTGVAKPESGRGSAPLLTSPRAMSGPIAVENPDSGRGSAPLLTSPRAGSGPIAAVREDVSARVPVPALAPEPSRPRRPRVQELIDQAAELSARVAVAMPDLDVHVDVDSVLTRARALAGGELDAELEALREAAAAPIEISVEAASAELARQLGGKPIAKRERSARWAPPPAVELRPEVRAAIEAPATDVAQAFQTKTRAQTEAALSATIAAVVEAAIEAKAPVVAPATEQPAATIGVDPQRERSEAAPERSAPAPVFDNAAPERSEAAPVFDNAAPEHSEAAPERSEAAPVFDEPAPERSEAAPERSEAVPVFDEPAPERSEAAPERTAAAPLPDDAAPELGAAAEPSRLASPSLVPQESYVIRTSPDTPALDDAVAEYAADDRTVAPTGDEDDAPPLDARITADTNVGTEPSAKTAARHEASAERAADRALMIDDDADIPSFERALDAARVHTGVSAPADEVELDDDSAELLASGEYELDEEFRGESTQIGGPAGAADGAYPPMPDQLAAQLDQQLAEAEAEADRELADGLQQPYETADPEAEEISDLDVLAEADEEDEDLLRAHGEAEISGRHASAPEQAYAADPAYAVADPSLQDAYAHPDSEHPHPAQAGYGEPPYAQPGYGEPPYAQPGYGADPYAQPAYGADPAYAAERASPGEAAYAGPAYVHEPYASEQALGERAYPQEGYGAEQAYQDQHDPAPSSDDEQAYVAHSAYGEQPDPAHGGYGEQAYAQPAYGAEHGYGEEPYPAPAYGEQFYAAQEPQAVDPALVPEPIDDFAARLDLGDDDEPPLPSDDIDREAAREFDAHVPAHVDDDGYAPAVQEPAYERARRASSDASEYQRARRASSDASEYQRARRASSEPSDFTLAESMAAQSPSFAPHETGEEFDEPHSFAAPPGGGPDSRLLRRGRATTASTDDLEDALAALDVGDIDLEQQRRLWRPTPNSPRPLPGLPIERPSTGPVPRLPGLPLERPITGEVPVTPAPTASARPPRPTGAHATAKPPPIPAAAHKPPTQQVPISNPPAPAPSKRAATEDDGVIIDFDDDE